MVNEFEVEKLIFEEYEKPKNYLATKVINVYNNRYRINIYHEIFDADLNIYKKRMYSSYFCKYDNGKLEVLYPKNPS
jgi:hypothetical protein